MGIVQIETPAGVKKFEVAGDKPTTEELNEIESQFTSQQPNVVGFSSFDELMGAVKKANETEGFDYETGADSALRAQISFGETESEREGILQKLVGKEGYTRDSQGQLALTSIGQEIRGMSPSEKNIVIEDEGFSLGDLADLAGILPETIGSVIGGVLGTGAGLGFGSLFTGAAGAAAGAAAGQGLEELIEEALGIQKQSLPEVLVDMGQEAALAGVLDLATVGLWRAGKAVVGGGAKRLTSRGESISPEMGADLVGRGYKPSLERLGAPTILAKGAKFAKGATGDVSDIVNNTSVAIAEKDAFLQQLKIFGTDEAGEAFINVGTKKFAELQAKQTAAQRAAMKTVQESIDLVERSVDEGFSINNETLNAIHSSFKNFQDVAVGEFKILDDMVGRLESSQISDAITVNGKTRIVPTDILKQAANDLIEATGSAKVLPAEVQIALKGIDDLNKTGKASFAQIATQRKLVNDALFEKNLGPAATEQLFKLRDAFDSAISADYLTKNLKGLSGSQRTLVNSINKQRDVSFVNYAQGMKKFDDLRTFGIVRDIKQSIKQDGKFNADQFFTKIVRKDSPERLKAVLNAVDDRELVRSQLARSFLDDAMSRTGVDMMNPNNFNGALFRNQIMSLKSTGKELFGAEWGNVQKLAETIAQVGVKNTPKESVENIMKLNADRSIVDAMQDLVKATNDIGQAQKLRAMDKLAKGDLQPDEAVSSLINYKTSLSDWQKIRNVFRESPQELLEVRKAMIEKILSAVNEDVFTSPAAALTLKKELGNYKQGVLQKVLSKPVYDNINKFADEMIYLGDVGKEGAIAQAAVTAKLTSDPVGAFKQNLRMKSMATVFSNPTLINYYAGKGAPTAISNVSGVLNAIGNTIGKTAATINSTRQFGVRALNEQMNREIDAYNTSTTQPQKDLPMYASPAPTPVQSSGLGSVDITQPQPLIGGTTAPIGAQGSLSSGGGLRQMATNNPAIADALGIRGATADLLRR